MVRHRRVKHHRRSYARYGGFRGFRRHKKQPVALAPLIGGVVAPMSSAFFDAGGLPALQSDPMGFGQNFVKEIGLRYVGIDLYNPASGFQFDKVAWTYGGALAGFIGHKVATKFGINKQISRIPIIGGKVGI